MRCNEACTADRGGGGADGGGGGGSEPPPETNDCSDQAAMDAADEIKNDDNPDFRDESVSTVYKAADGSIQRTPVTSFEGVIIPYEYYDEILAEHGISWSQGIGMVHSHPTSTASEFRANIGRYPSGAGGYYDGNWGFGNYAIERGALNFQSLYILDAFGKLREFNWKDRDMFISLTDEQKADGNGLPNETTGCGS